MPLLQITSDIVFNTLSEENEKELSGTIGLRVDGFSFARFCQRTNQVFDLKDVLFDPDSDTSARGEAIRSFLHEHLHENNLANVSLLLQSDAFMPIPTGVSADESRELFCLMSDLSQDSELMVERLSWFSADLVSEIPSALHNVAGLLSEMKQSGTMVNAWLDGIMKQQLDSGVFVHVGTHKFWLAIIYSGKLQLLNAFPYGGLSDFIYYLLGAVKTNGSPSIDSLYVSGAVLPSSALWKSLCGHFVNVLPLNPSSYSAQHHEKPLHLVFPLIR